MAERVNGNGEAPVETVESLPEMQRIAEEPEGAGDAAILDELPLVPEAFSVRDENSANWVTLKINQARARKARAKAFAAREVARAEREEAFLLGRFGAQLEQYTRAQLEGGRLKSLSLPAGGLYLRTVPARLAVDNEDEAARWAQTNCPEVVVTVPSMLKLDVRALQQLHKREGVLPPGTHVEEEHESFSVRED